MHICHLGKFYHPHAGGIESHVRTLAQAQAACGYQVSVACISHASELPPSTSDGPVDVRRFRPRFSIAKFDWLPGVSRYLDRSGFDILHLHLPNPAMTIPVLSMQRQIPLCITYHSDVIGMSLRKWLFEPLNQRLLKRAQVIAATNPRMAAASPVLSQHRERVCSIPLGIPLSRFLHPSLTMRQRAATFQHEVTGPIWLMCGRLVSYKGHEIALRALVSTQGTLVIIGDGALRESLTALARELQISERVKFLGHVASDEEVQAWYLAATALWMPSILPSEAFGLVQVEAMASGCPVINTDIPGSGVSWVSQHDLTGLTVPVGDSAALAAAASLLVEKVDLRERYAHAARQRAISMFDHNVMANRWAAVYGSLRSETNRSEPWSKTQELPRSMGCESA